VSACVTTTQRGTEDTQRCSASIIQVRQVRVALYAVCCCTDPAMCEASRMRRTLRAASPRRVEAEERSTKRQSTWPTYGKGGWRGDGKEAR
jgi:hypothetical protein